MHMVNIGWKKKKKWGKMTKMIDISEKELTKRTALAKGEIKLKKKTILAIPRRRTIWMATACPTAGRLPILWPPSVGQMRILTATA